MKAVLKEAMSTENVELYRSKEMSLAISFAKDGRFIVRKDKKNIIDTMMSPMLPKMDRVAFIHKVATLF